MAKQFTTVKELTGNDFAEILRKAKAKFSEGVDAAFDAFGNVLEEGSKYRLSVRNKEGETAIKMTATVGGILGLTVTALIGALLTLCLGTAALIAGLVTEHKLVIEKVVEGAATTEKM